MTTPRLYLRRLSSRRRFTSRANPKALTGKSPLYARIAQNWRAQLSFPGRAGSLTRVHGLYASDSSQTSQGRRAGFFSDADTAEAQGGRDAIRQGTIDLTTESVREQRRSSRIPVDARRAPVSNRGSAPVVIPSVRSNLSARGVNRAQTGVRTDVSPVISAFESPISLRARLAESYTPSFLGSVPNFGANRDVPSRYINLAQFSDGVHLSGWRSHDAGVWGRYSASLNVAEGKARSAGQLESFGPTSSVRQVSERDRRHAAPSNVARGNFSSGSLRYAMVAAQSSGRLLNTALPNRIFSGESYEVNAPSSDSIVTQAPRWRLVTSNVGIDGTAGSRRSLLFDGYARVQDAPYSAGSEFSPQAGVDDATVFRAPETIAAAYGSRGVGAIGANGRALRILRASERHTRSLAQSPDAHGAITRTSISLGAADARGVQEVDSMRGVDIGVAREGLLRTSPQQSALKRELPLESVLENLLAFSGMGSSTSVGSRRGKNRDPASLTDAESGVYAGVAQAPGVRLDAIEELLKDSRDALRALVRLGNIDWTLDVP